MEVSERKYIQIKVEDCDQLPSTSSKEIQKELTGMFPVSFEDVPRIEEWVKVEPAMRPPSPEILITKNKEAEERVFKKFKQSPNPDQTGALVSRYSTFTLDEEMNFQRTRSLIDLRLNAIKELQDDPTNLFALRQMHEAERLLTQKMNGEQINCNTARQERRRGRRGRRAKQAKVGNFAKNPISILQEYCDKKKYVTPAYDLAMTYGHEGAQKFIMKCIVNGVWYKPTAPCRTKKEAKELAAFVALQVLGIPTY